MKPSPGYSPGVYCSSNLSCWYHHLPASPHHRLSSAQPHMADTTDVFSQVRDSWGQQLHSLWAASFSVTQKLRKVYVSLESSLLQLGTLFFSCPSRIWRKNYPHLYLVLNVLDKVTVTDNNISHSSELFSAHTPSCSRKYMGCSRAASCNLLMENMFKVSHVSVLFCSVTPGLQYPDGTAFTVCFPTLPITCTVLTATVPNIPHSTPARKPGNVFPFIH